MKTKDIKPPKEGSPNGAKKMSEVISMKDYYNHDTRIALVENAIINIEKRFDQVDKQFEKVDKRLDRMEAKGDSQFKWLIGCIGMLSLTTISTLITVVMTVGRHSA
jgi:hypothetical protein